MKKIIMFLTCLAVWGMSYGKSVDVNTAQTIGYNYLSAKGLVKSLSDMQLAYTATATVNGAGVNDFYVFNITSPSGFVMVSGDDRVMPVLAYSNTSSFGTSNIPTNISWWLKNYQDQINYVIKENLTASQETTDDWSALAQGRNMQAAAKTTNTSVNPLLHTAWDQEPYYNALCPFDSGSNEQTVTGCVATATAQVMRYWRWPVTGAGAHSYIDPTYGYQYANFSTTTYQWSNMPTSISGPNNDIAALMYQVGVSVDMTYGTAQQDGSGAYVLSEESTVTNCSEFALKTYFHYKQSLYGVERDYYENNDETAWINLIEAELNAGRPVLYEGFGSDGGHNWVADGYNTDNYIHFNWGWSAQSDGYYSVDDLAPPALGTGGGGSGNNFNEGQAVLVGIEPDSSSSVAGNIKLGAYISTTPSPTGYGQAFSFTTRILNSDTTTFTGSFMAAVLDTSGNILDTVQTIANDTIASGDTSAALTFATTGLYNLAPGIYTIRIYYAPANGNWSLVADNGNYINYATMAIANDTDLALYDNMQVTQNSLVSDTVVYNQPISVAIMVGNQGYSSFSGNLNLSLYNVNDGSLAFTIQELTNRYLNGYGQSIFTFADTNLSITPGVYLMMLEHEPTGNSSYTVTGSTYYPNPVFLTVDSVLTTDTTTTVPQVETNNTVTIYPNPASNVLFIDIHNLASVSTIKIIDMQGREMTALNAAGQQLITVPVGTLAAGLYFVEIQTGSGIITKKVSIIR